MLVIDEDETMQAAYDKAAACYSQASEKIPSLLSLILTLKTMVSRQEKEKNILFSLIFCTWS